MHKSVPLTSNYWFILLMQFQVKAVPSAHLNNYTEHPQSNLHMVSCQYIQYLGQSVPKATCLKVKMFHLSDGGAVQQLSEFNMVLTLSGLGVQFPVGRSAKNASTLTAVRYFRFHYLPICMQCFGGMLSMLNIQLRVIQLQLK